MKNLIAIFFALFLLVPAFTEAQNQEIDQPDGVEKIATVEGITEYQLTGNGLKILLFPDNTKPSITVNITYLVGSRHEAYGETGMAHLLEHLVFKGTPNHPDIPKELNEHGASFNGTTWTDRTNYFETFTATDENLEWALEMEADRMVNSFISGEDLASEMTVVRNEFEWGENSPDRVLNERILSTAFLWHNYGNSTIGARSDIENVPINRLQNFYKKYYQPDNAVLVVAGKIDPEKTLQLITETFGLNPRPDRDKPGMIIYDTYTKEPTQDGERLVTLRRTGDIKAVAAGYHIPPASDDDFPALQVLTRVLSDQPNGRLYKALVESQLATSLYAYNFAFKESSYMYINANLLKDGSVETVKDTMTAVLDHLGEKPVTDEETERAKNQLIKSWNMAFNDVNRIGTMLSEYIAKGDWRLMFLHRDAVEKVTPEQVMKAYDAYIKPSNRTIGIFLPTENPDRAEIPDVRDIAAIVRDYKGRDAVAAGEAFEATPENIENRTNRGALENDIAYALLEKQTRGNQVNMRLAFRMGNLDDLRGHSIAGDLMTSLLNKGTEKHNRQQIEDFFDENEAQVMIYGAQTGVYTNIQVKKENLMPVLDMVAEILTIPSFPENEFTKIIQSRKESIESSRNNPQAIAANAMSRHFSNITDKDDPRYVRTFDENMEAMNTIKLEDVRSFYNKFMGFDHADMAAIGPIDEEKLKTAVEEKFGTKVKKIPYERIPRPFHKTDQVDEEFLSPDKANAVFFARQNFKINTDNPDYPALLMANHILGGGALKSRLADRIRQKEGLSYGVGSFINVSDFEENGYIGAYAIYAPENKAKVQAAFEEEVQKFYKEGITKEELAAAKQGILQKRELSRSQDDSLVRKLTSYLYLDRTLEYDKQLEESINALTMDEVNDAFHKYVNPEGFSYFKAGDFEKAESP